MAKVFISYSRRDVEFARQLHDRLRAMGYETWIDIEDIPKGAPWDNSIDAGLKQSDIIVGVLSPDSVASDNVKNEWGWALTYDKPLLLLMLHPCEVPHRYVRINYIDFTKSPEDGFGQLQTALISADRSVYQDDAGAASSSATLSAAPEARFTWRAFILGLIGLLALAGIAAAALLAPMPGSAACLAGMGEIPAGDFWMGAAPDDPDAKDDEKPAATITLDGFCMDRTEVSNRQYAEFVKAVNFTPPPGWTGTQYPAGTDDFPVVNVTWTDARAYCNWAQKQLPTEAQWEKAARGADQENPRLYPWGNDWKDDRANSAYTRSSAPMAVESFPDGASPYGVLNMAGNVAEWVADYYQDDWYVRIPKVNPTGPEFAVGGIHVIRGGYFSSGQADLRVSARNGEIAPHLSAIVLNFVGIRCASDIKT